MAQALVARSWWVAAALCAALCLAIWGYTVDDAYIVFRYARNLVEGHGPVFNIGDRVEGFSSPLWLAVATLAEGLHLPVEHVCKALSLAAVIAMFWYIARRIGALSPTARLPLLLLAAYAPLHVAVVCGLETAVNAVIVTCLLLSSHKPATRGMAAALSGQAPPDDASAPPATSDLSSSALALWGCLALLCRPENGLLVGVHGLYLWSLRPDQRRKLYIAAAVWLAVGVLLTLARFAYYGALLPNTAVAKVSIDSAFGSRGWSYCSTWLQQFWWLPLLGLSSLVDRSNRRLVLNALLLIAAQVAFVFFVGGDWMPQWRFLLPAGVLLAVLACFGLDAILLRADDLLLRLVGPLSRPVATSVARHSDRILTYGTGVSLVPILSESSGQPLDAPIVTKALHDNKLNDSRSNRPIGLASSRSLAQRLPALACLSAVLLLLALQFAHLRAVRWYLDSSRRQLDALAAGPVQYLADHAAPSDLVVARDIGILGYKTRCRILDVVGLTDPHVARSSGYRHRDRIDNDYIFARAPAYLMLQTGNDRDADPIPLDSIARSLMSDARFASYRLCRHWDLPSRHYCEIYARIGSPADSPTAMLGPAE
jgi:hypothetical protein